MRIAASVLLFASFAFAQTGTYKTFGGGCRGTGGNINGCIAANLSGAFSGNTGGPTFALAAKTGTQGRTICAFEFFAATFFMPQVKNAWLYDADSQGKPNKVLRSAKIRWTLTPGWHRATIAPVFVPPNTKFFVALENPGRLPTMMNGPDTVEVYFNRTNWSGPTTGKWNYNVICCGQSGNAVPQLGNKGVPSINQTFDVTLDRAARNSTALLILGFSRSNWGPFKLPLGLDGAGAKGCSLLVSYDVVAAATIGSEGAVAAPLAFPNVQQLIGLAFHNQWAVIDPRANALGVVFSNGGSGTIGR